MKQELVQLAKDKGFVATFVYDKPFIYSSKEPLRWLFWMTELQKWLREVYNLEINIYDNTLEKKYAFSVGKCFSNNIIVGSGTWMNSNPLNKYYDTYELALENALSETLKLLEDE